MIFPLKDERDHLGEEVDGFERQACSPGNALDLEEVAAAGDMDWRTHSLPSLNAGGEGGGRVSSDNTLESLSGAEEKYTTQGKAGRKGWKNNQVQRKI